MNERERALEQWRQGKEKPQDDVYQESEEPGKPVVHFFTPEQEKRFGVGPEKPFNPDNFISKGVR